MNLLLKKGISLASSIAVLLGSAQQFCFATSSETADSAVLSIGKICISPDELAANDYKVSVPVKVFGAANGVLSFDSTYIAFSDIDSGENSLDIGNICADNAEISISQADIASDDYNITSSFDLVQSGISAFAISGYCSENQSGDEITLCELTFTLPQSAQSGDIYNIVWFDALNTQLAPAVCSQNGDYELSFVSGLIYIGSLGVANDSQYQSIYLAEDTSALTNSIGIGINPDVQGHTVVDISQLVSFGINGCQSLDINSVENGDNAVSPFDLYWSAYQSGTPTNSFWGSCTADITCFDELCERMSPVLGIELSSDADFGFFENVLFDESGTPLSLGEFEFKIAQRGDANLDHSVDAKDAAAIAKYTSQLAILAPGADEPVISQSDDALAKSVADTNNDGFIDAKDAANAAKFSSESSISSFDAPKAYYTIWNDILN